MFKPITYISESSKSIPRSIVFHGDCDKGFVSTYRISYENEVFLILLHRDFMLAFGKWEFDPMDLSNPYPQSESSMYIWQGYEDKVVPFQLQRFVSGKLPWIRYHEVPNGGHLIVYYNGVCEAILRALLLGEGQVSYRPSTAKVLP
jgi:pimeloyl-ACP methyl ester carboxylesterase